MRLIFIIHDGEERDRVLKAVDSILSPFKDGFDYDFFFAKGYQDASRLVSLYCDLHKELPSCFIVCGGDLLVDGVASGLMGADEGKTMTVLDTGSPNCLLEYFDGLDFKDLGRLLRGHTASLDILRVNNSFTMGSCCFGRAADLIPGGGTGEDGRRQSGLVKTCFFSRFGSFKITSSGKVLPSGKVLMCTVSNGLSFKKVQCAPTARMDDGKADVCLVRPTWSFRFRPILDSISKGEHIGGGQFSKDMEFLRTDVLEIEARKPFPLWAGYRLMSESKFKIRVIPGAVRFIVPDNES